jgi:hypothetical protein
LQKLIDVARHPIYQIDCVALQNKNGKQVFDLAREVISHSSVKKGLRRLPVTKGFPKAQILLFFTSCNGKDLLGKY